MDILYTCAESDNPLKIQDVSFKVMVARLYITVKTMSAFIFVTSKSYIDFGRIFRNVKIMIPVRIQLDVTNLCKDTTKTVLFQTSES